jgi:hypothetical protein
LEYYPARRTHRIVYFSSFTARKPTELRNDHGQLDNFAGQSQPAAPTIPIDPTRADPRSRRELPEWGKGRHCCWRRGKVGKEGQTGRAGAIEPPEGELSHTSKLPRFMDRGPLPSPAL